MDVDDVMKARLAKKMKAFSAQKAEEIRRNLNKYKKQKFIEIDIQTDPINAIEPLMTRA